MHKCELFINLQYSTILQLLHSIMSVLVDSHSTTFYILQLLDSIMSILVEVSNPSATPSTSAVHALGCLCRSLAWSRLAAAAHLGWS